MSNGSVADYLALVQQRPHLFVNPDGAGYVILLTVPEIQEVEAQVSRRLEAKELPTEWARVGIAFRDQYTMILRDAVRFPDGSLSTYSRVVPPQEGALGVVILPVYQGQVLLLRHFRHATRDWHLEIPRGFGTVGSSAEDNARRELKEEVGGIASRVVSLGQVRPDAGMDAGLVELFLAELESYAEVESEEAISELRTVPVAEFERLIRESEITDGFSIVAYARAKLKGLI